MSRWLPRLSMPRPTAAPINSAQASAPVRRPLCASQAARTGSRGSRRCSANSARATRKRGALASRPTLSSALRLAQARSAADHDAASGGPDSTSRTSSTARAAASPMPLDSGARTGARAGARTAHGQAHARVRDRAPRSNRSSRPHDHGAQSGRTITLRHRTAIPSARRVRPRRVRHARAPVRAQSRAVPAARANAGSPGRRWPGNASRRSGS